MNRDDKWLLSYVATIICTMSWALCRTTFTMVLMVIVIAITAVKSLRA